MFRKKVTAVFLVTVSDYDTHYIESAWLTEAEAEAAVEREGKKALWGYRGVERVEIGPYKGDKEF